MPGEQLAQPSNSESFRPHFLSFFRSLNQDDITEALHVSLASFEGNNSEDAKNIAVRLGPIAKHLHLSHERFSSVLPSWINPLGFVMEIDSLNKPTFWHELLQKAKLKDPTIMSNLERTLIVPDRNAQGSPEMNVARTIADNNGKFYQMATTALTFSALLGRDIEKIFKAPDDDDINSFATLTVLPLVLLMGKHFDTPASSIEELIPRLQELFPTNDEQNDFQAFTLLQRQNAFGAYKISDDNSTPSRVVCPASKFTNEIYHAYGRMLRNPQYIDGFRRRVGKKRWTAHLLES